MTDFFKAVAALAGAIVAIIGLATALGWPPKPPPTSPPPTSSPQVSVPSIGPGSSVIDSSTRAVPDVTGLQDLDAVNRLRDDGFQPRPGGFEASSTVVFGAVVRTDPPAGTQVTKGSPVTIFISTGPP